MDRIWQWAWDRYATRYSWALCGVVFLASLLIYLLPTVLVIAFEGSSHYVESGR
jgi:adenylate cyclase